MTNQFQKWHELLIEAIKQPGLIHSAYHAFHGYSLSNRLAAWVQCQIRGLQPSPIATYIRWKELGRHVRKGEKAITLCMPLTRKVKNDMGEDDELITTFVWKNAWFLMSQTDSIDGEPMSPIEIPTWDKVRALETLGITQVEFTHLDGNVMGYAEGRQVAISPLAPLPYKTLFHELAHIELGHTSESSFSDSEQTPRSLREVESESVSLLMCEALSLEGAIYCRGYVRSWLDGDVIPDRSAMKILGCAERLLRAGRQ